MVTNGTIMTDDLIDAIKSYKIGLTVSLDGPEVINGDIRIYLDGKGSFFRVVRFIKTIQKDTESYLGIEGTYTARHIEKGISLVDLMDFFSEELGITSAHIPPVGAPTDQTLELHPNYSEEVKRMYADAVSYTTGSIFDVPGSHCELVKEMAERTLVELVKVRGWWRI